MTRKHILIADDTPMVRDLLTKLIKRMGDYAVITTKDGIEALTACATPGLVLHAAFLDQNMPGFTGLELIKLIKPAQPDCRLILVTAQSDPATVRAAIAAGVSGFVVKPFSVAQIEQLLHSP